jgi:ABC-type branched-subunit amino acid transport system permease subunit
MKTWPESIRITAVVALVVAAAAVGIVGPDYLKVVVVSALTFGLFAASVAISIDYAGVLSLGTAAYFAIGAYATALAQRNGWGYGSGVLAGSVTAGGLAAGLGAAGLTSRRTPIQYALLTLVVSLTLQQLAISSYDVTGGSNGLPGITAPSVFGTKLSLEAEYFVAIAVIFATFCGLYALMRTSFGKLLILSRDVPERTEALGHNVKSLKIFATGLNAIVAALCGSIFVTFNGIAYPGMFAALPNLLVIVWVAVGSGGGISGAFLSATILNLIEFELGSEYTDVYRLFIGGLLIYIVSAATPRFWRAATAKEG